MMARLTPRSPRKHEGEIEANSETGTPTALQAYLKNNIPQNSSSNNTVTNNNISSQPTNPPSTTHGGGGGTSLAHNYTYSFRSDGTGPFSPNSVTHAPRTTGASSFAGDGVQRTNTGDHINGPILTSRPSMMTMPTSERLDSSRLVSPRRATDNESHSFTAANRQSEKDRPSASNGSTIIPKQKHSFVKSPRPCFSCPVIVLLAIQCVLIAIGFTALITMTAVRTDSLTTNMVQEKVHVDLEYARLSILTPLQEYEKTILLVRNRYLTQSAVQGKEMCSDDSPNFAASEPFLSDGVLVRLTHPQVAYVFHLRKSKQHFSPVTGEAELCACAAIPTGVLTLVNGTNRFSAPVTQVLLEHKALGILPWISRNDRIDFLYGLVRFGTPYFSWNTILYYDEDARNGFLYLIGFAPNEVVRTINGTITETFRPVVTGPQTLDPTLSATSTTGIAINFTSFGPILANVTPHIEGAHTSVYNLDRMELVGTSEPFKLFDSARRLYKAGQSPSASINEAYNTMVGDFLQTTTIPSISNGGSTIRKVATTFRVKFDVDGRVISSTPITTLSGINFVVIQSTPSEHYFTETKELLTQLLALGAGIGVAILLICVVVGVSIRMPLGKMRSAMELAATMRNDQVISTNSFLTDLDVLCAALDQMNIKLLQAREFMPQALLCDDSNEEGDEDEGEVAIADGSLSKRKQIERPTTSDDEEQGSEMMTRSYSKRAVSPGYVVASSSMMDSSIHTQQSTATAATTGKVSSNPRYLTSSLAQKRVTILAINTIGFHSKVNTSAPLTVQESAATITNIINAICNRERGVIDSFHGDHFVISFNAARANAQGPIKALRCAQDIIADMPPPFVSSASPVRFSMGVATGRACVGHLGTSGMKRLSIVGKVYSKAMSLERICKQFGVAAVSSSHWNSGLKLGAVRGGGQNRSMYDVPIECVIDAVMAAEVNHSYRLQVLGAIGATSTYAPQDTGATIPTLLPTLPHFPVPNHSFQNPNGMTDSKSEHPNSAVVDTTKTATTMLGVGATTTQATTPRNVGVAQQQGSPSYPKKNLLPISSAYARIPPLPNCERELELLFAVRGAKKQNVPTTVGGGGGGFTSDEWLYEMNRSQTGHKIEEINKVVIEYLNSLRSVAPNAAANADHHNNHHQSESSTTAPQPQETSLAMSVQLMAMSQQQQQPPFHHQQPPHSRSTSEGALALTAMSSVSNEANDKGMLTANGVVLNKLNIVPSYSANNPEDKHNASLTSPTAAGYPNVMTSAAVGPLPFSYYREVEKELAAAKANLWGALQIVAATHFADKTFSDSNGNLRAALTDRAALDYALGMAEVGEPFNGIFSLE